MAFKLLHKLRLNITVEVRGAVKWDESVVVGGLQRVSHHHHLLNYSNIISDKTLGKNTVKYEGFFCFILLLKIRA